MIIKANFDLLYFPKKASFLLFPQTVLRFQNHPNYALHKSRSTQNLMGEKPISFIGCEKPNVANFLRVWKPTAMGN